MEMEFSRFFPAPSTHSETQKRDFSDDSMNLFRFSSKTQQISKFATTLRSPSSISAQKFRSYRNYSATEADSRLDTPP